MSTELRQAQPDALPGYGFSFSDTTPLLPSENPAEFDDLCQKLTHHFKPGDDPAQARYVREMADAEWNLRRIRRWKQDAYARKFQQISEANPQETALRLEALTFEVLMSRGSSYLAYAAQEKLFRTQFDQAAKALAKQAEDVKRSRISTARVISAETAAEADKLMNGFQMNELRKLASPSPQPPPTPRVIHPRSAPCPCGSGEKFKRCCGRGAPPKLC